MLPNRHPRRRRTQELARLEIGNLRDTLASEQRHGLDVGIVTHLVVMSVRRATRAGGGLGSGRDRGDSVVAIRAGRLAIGDEQAQVAVILALNTPDHLERDDKQDNADAGGGERAVGADVPGAGEEAGIDDEPVPEHLQTFPLAWVHVRKK